MFLCSMLSYGSVEWSYYVKGSLVGKSTAAKPTHMKSEVKASWCSEVLFCDSTISRV